MNNPHAMGIILNPTSAVPVFEQIGVAIRQQIEQGTLSAGTRLPATRTLAQELGLAVNTVAKAYRVLEAQGVLEGRGRHGTFVSDPHGGAAQRAAADFVATMRSLGKDRAQVAELVERAWTA